MPSRRAHTSGGASAFSTLSLLAYAWIVLVSLRLLQRRPLTALTNALARRQVGAVGGEHHRADDLVAELRGVFVLRGFRAPLGHSRAIRCLTAASAAAAAPSFDLAACTQRVVGLDVLLRRGRIRRPAERRGRPIARRRWLQRKCNRAERGRSVRSREQGMRSLVARRRRRSW